MRLVVLGAVLTVAVIFVVVLAEKWIRERKKQRSLKEARFVGGPLDGKVKRVPELQAVFVSGRAVYQHDEFGVYTYLGVTSDPNVISPELDP